MRFLALVTLFALVGTARADEPDPEPPGGSAGVVRRLQGKRKASHLLHPKGRRAAPPITYEFRGNRALVDRGGKYRFTASVRINARTQRLVLVRDDTKEVESPAFDLRDGELRLAIRPTAALKEKLDFTGRDGPVYLLVLEKK